MIRELKNKILGDGRAAAELAVKNGLAEREAAAKQLDEALASLAEASARVSGGGIDREAIRGALLDEQVEQRLVENAKEALKKAEARLAEREAAADRLARQAIYDRATARLNEAETAFRTQYGPNLSGVLNALAIAAAAEKAVAEANAHLPEGAKPFVPPFDFASGAPKFLQVTALDGQGRKLWIGDQFAQMER